LLNILVTGAAGLVGGELCARLLAEGHTVTALVHRNHDIFANDGSAVAVAATKSGDVSQKRFGWEETEFASIASAHDLLIHCAATVRFDLEEAEYAAVNVNGTANALALAKTGDMAFLHVSTAYVCGTRDGTIGEADALPSSGFANGYEASKAAGERLVRSSDVDWAIARPSIVVGASGTGTIRQFDTTYAAFKLIAEGRVRQMPSRSGATLDFVPIDHVASGIVAIADGLAKRTPEVLGGTFHLVSGQPMPVEQFTAAIGAYPHFHEPELVSPENFDPSHLPALERRLFKRVAGLYANYFQRNPHFDDSAFRSFFGIECPATDMAYIKCLIDYCIEAGFLRAAEE
jgi:nucleoside-diphosphate-sugar epimerase